MAKQIIVLENLDKGKVSFKFAMWAAVPVARQPFYANAGLTSQFKDASASEITAIQNGEIVERVEEITFDQNKTVAQIKNELEARFTSFQAEITGKNDWKNYGTFYENGTWTNGGVA